MDPPYSGPKVEARQGSSGSYVRTPREIEVDPKAQIYGSRWVVVEEPGKKPFCREVPLTWDDLFDPQDGDHVSHGSEHADLIFDIRGMLKALFRSRGRNDVLVCDDMKMFWADPSVSRVSPDIAVTFGLDDPERSRDSFNEAKEGTRPSFVLEITSKATAHFDRNDKPDVFRKAKIQEVLLLDRLKTPWRISGYRLDAMGRKRAISKDKQGRVLAKTLDIFFSIAEGGEGVVLTDAQSGKILVPPLAAQAVAEQRVADLADAQAAEATARALAEQKVAEQEAKLQELMAEIERLKSSP